MYLEGIPENISEKNHRGFPKLLLEEMLKEFLPEFLEESINNAQ